MRQFEIKYTDGGSKVIPAKNLNAAKEFAIADGDHVVSVKECHNKLWCAYCGEWGDHQSGWCPHLQKG